MGALWGALVGAVVGPVERAQGVLHADSFWCLRICLVDLSAADMAGYMCVREAMLVLCVFADHVKAKSHDRSGGLFLSACRGVWRKEKGVRDKAFAFTCCIGTKNTCWNARKRHAVRGRINDLAQYDCIKLTVSETFWRSGI